MVNLFTQSQVFDMAIKAGFNAGDAEIISAISLAESLYMKNGVQYANFDLVGDLHLVNATWGPSYGGLQIRSLVSEMNTGKTRDASMLTIPEFNVKSGFNIFKVANNSFKPWSTYKNKTYLGYMKQAVHNPVPVTPAGVYMVTGGDSLYRIGSKTGFDWRLLAAFNHIVSPYTIDPGQNLRLPDIPYTVVAGDTLYGIAARMSKVTYGRIMEYNKLLTTNLSVGQKLLIPQYTSWDGRILI